MEVKNHFPIICLDGNRLLQLLLFISISIRL